MNGWFRMDLIARDITAEREREAATFRLGRQLQAAQQEQVSETGTSGQERMLWQVWQHVIRGLHTARAMGLSKRTS